jgi:hypothetical protein
MSMTCSTNGEEKRIQDICGQNRTKETTRKTTMCVCVCVDNIKWILERWDGAIWIYLAQDRDRCRVLVNTVMICRVS